VGGTKKDVKPEWKEFREGRRKLKARGLPKGHFKGKKREHYRSAELSAQLQDDFRRKGRESDGVKEN